MAKVVAYINPNPRLQLVYDTEDVESFSSPRDVHTLTCAQAECGGCLAVHREIGQAHLIINFKAGRQAMWEPVG